LALLAAGCGGGDGEDATPPVAVPSSTAAPDPEAAAPDPEPPAADEAPPESEPPDADDERPDPNEPGVTAAPIATESPPEAEPPAEPPASTVPPRPQSPPYRAELPWGSFLLADRTANKLLTLNETLNFVLSVGATSDGGSGPAMGEGWTRGAEEAAARHGAAIEARVVGPWGDDPDAQAAEIDELVVAGEVDCLAVEAPAGDELARVIDRAANSGVPVFTVGADSPGSKRFAFYGLDHRDAGAHTGRVVGRWALDGRILLRKGAVLAADASDERSRLLMEGFIDGIGEELPDLEFVNGPDTAESLGADPDAAYLAAGEWIEAHPDVDIIFHPDPSLEDAARHIAVQALYGEVSTAGFHMSDSVVNYVYEGVVVAAMVPGLANQAASAADACGDFLLAGAYDTGRVAVDPTAVTEDNLEERDWTAPESR
jgi:ABC-type sugar transport system substrate-binding protein